MLLLFVDRSLYSSVLSWPLSVLVQYMPISILIKMLFHYHSWSNSLPDWNLLMKKWHRNENPTLACIQKTLLLKLMQVTSDIKLFFESQLSSMFMHISQEFGFTDLLFSLSLSVHHCLELSYSLVFLAKSHILLLVPIPAHIYNDKILNNFNIG